MVDTSMLTDRAYVAKYIKSSLEETLRWTTLICDWRSVDMEIPYNLVFSSSSQPWGYRYRLFDSKGNMQLANIAKRDDLERIIISLISKFCLTKFGNLVDGRDTVYRFVPQAKKAYKG